MTPKRKKRLIMVLVILLGMTTAVGFAAYALKQNISLYFTPTQVATGQAPVGHSFRLGGLVVKGSVKRETTNLKVHFVLTDLNREVPVEYKGILPDLFREGQGIVAEGKLDAKQRFVASQVLAKHDEKYMPPEVADSLKKSSHQ